MEMHRWIPWLLDVDFDRWGAGQGNHSHKESGVRIRNVETHLHKLKLFLCCKTREMHPTRTLLFSQIIPILFDCPKTYPSQSIAWVTVTGSIPMDFKDEFYPAFIVAGTCEYITLFPCADLWTYGVYHSFLWECSEGKVIMTAVAQSISIVYQSNVPVTGPYTLHCVIERWVRLLQVHLLSETCFLNEVLKFAKSTESALRDDSCCLFQPDIKECKVEYTAVRTRQSLSVK
jgi:hypothetical protein